MTNTAILAASALLVLAYLIDILCKRLRLPAVVLLIGTGIAIRQLADPFGLHLDWVDPIVPIIGTLGLILIVLEGALDLQVTSQRVRLIATSATAAVLGFALSLAVIAAVFAYQIGLPSGTAVLAALPFAVISSAVAIPSAAALPLPQREFVVYESSVSDIVGVLVFYAWLHADGSFGNFTAEVVVGGLVSLVVAAIAAAGLYALINRVEGHVRFLPLLAGLVLLYSVGKASHLSPLVLVLVCGLLLNNPQLLERTRHLKRLHTERYDATLREFKGLVAELTFATKSFFFLLLGYWTDLARMADPEAWILAGWVVLAIYSTRWLLLKALRQDAADRLMWIAPRGLITVLLFLAATETGALGPFPFGTVMLVVLVTATLTALAQRRPASAATA
jgi:hypothetical protein